MVILMGKVSIEAKYGLIGLKGLMIIICAAHNFLASSVFFLFFLFLFNYLSYKKSSSDST